MAGVAAGVPRRTAHRGGARARSRRRGRAHRGVDVGDARSSSALPAGYAGRGWPPIRGVVHAAGVLDNQLGARMDRATFDAVLAPKLRGAQSGPAAAGPRSASCCSRRPARVLAQPGRPTTRPPTPASTRSPTIAARAACRRSASAGASGATPGSCGRRRRSATSRSWHARASTASRRAQASALFTALCGQPDAVDHRAADRLGGVRAGASRSRAAALPRAAADRGRRSGSRRRWRALGARLAGRLRRATPQLLDAVVREAVGRVLKLAPARIDPRKALGSHGPRTR